MGTTARVVRRPGKFKLPKGIVGHTKVKVGFPATKTTRDVLNKAMWTHFGTSKNPDSEWPFLSNSFDDNRRKYLGALKGESKAILRGNKDAGQTMAKLGLMAQGDAQAEMVNISTPENKASTVKKKGSSNPTIDTGETKNHVTFQTYD